MRSERMRGWPYLKVSDYWKKVQKNGEAQNIDVLSPTVQQIVEFLANLFQDGLGYSAINTARSALSSMISIDNRPVGEHPLICRLMKGIFNLKPSLPKYSHIWDVGDLLSYFQRLPKFPEMSLKDLTYTTATLLCILTGQRCQTLHKMNIDYIHILPDRLRITIPHLLKTSKPGKHQAPLEIIAYPEDPSICIVTRFNEYISRTASLRKQNTTLFLSIQSPYQPVTKDTLERWAKESLKNAGIDTKVGPHSCRAASTSAAHKSGLSLAEIIKSAGWTSAQTFARFYSKTIQTDNFGQTILNNCNSSN